MNTSSPSTPKPLSPLKILLMGPPGSRKTTFMLQFPDIHVENCDNNLDGPEHTIRFGIKDSKGTLIVPPFNPNLSYTYTNIRTDSKGEQRAVEDCYNALCDDLKLFRTDERYKVRKWVGVDSLSHVNEFIIRHVLRMQNKTQRVGDMEARDWSPFKSAAYQLLVGRLEETGKHVICNAHEQKVYGKADKENMMNPPIEEYEPFFQGKVGEMLGAFFTDVWRMEVRPAPLGKTETWLMTDKAPKLPMLKNSLGLPPQLDVSKGFAALEPYLKGRL